MTLFSDARSNGSDTRINAALAANASMIESLGASFTNAQISSIVNSAREMAPSINQSEAYVALQRTPVTSGTKSTLLKEGVVAAQQSYLTLLEALENTLDGGRVLATSGIIHPNHPQLLDTNCVVYDVGVGLLGASAIITGGISLGVVAGITITWGMVFGASAAIMGSVAGDVTC